MSIQADLPERVEKPRPNREQVSNSGRRLSVISDSRERSEHGNRIAQGVVLTESNAYMSPSKTRSKRIPVAPEGTITTQKIYGDKIYPSGTGQKSRGLKRVKLDGKLTNVLKSELRMSYRCFGIKNNKLYAFVWQKDDAGEVGGAWFRTLDLKTYKYEDVDLSEDFENTFIQGGAYVPEENAFYGFGYQCWIRFDVATMTAVKLASPAAGTYNPQMTYNTRLRKLVAVNAQGEFYECSKSDGSQKLLKATGVISPYTAGLCYDAMSNHYIWATNSDDASELIAFNAETFEPLKICDIEDLAQLSVLFCDEAKQKDPQAPGVPEFVSSDFPYGSHTGTVEFRLPTDCNDGSPITSSMDYKLFINGIEYVPAKGSGRTGETVTLRIGEDAGLKDGIADFNLVCSIGSHESLDNSVNVYVGNDTPLAPANVTLSIDEISWDPVVAGVHGGYVDAGKIRYNVELNGKLIAKDISATSCATGLSADAVLSAYTAFVYASANGFTSEAGTSNDIIFGQAFPEPAHFEPTLAHSKLFVVDDANNDGATWQYHETSGAFRHKYSFYNTADDWLFLPPVKITRTDFMHKFSMTAWAVDNEVFEVFVGRDPSVAAMTQQVIGVSETPGKEARTLYEGMFDAPEAGEYYIGIHAKTPADRLFLYVKDMKVEVSPVSKNGPGVVTDVVSTPAEQGGLSATIAFKMPTVTINDTPLSGTIRAVVTGDLENKTVEGLPGSEQTVTLQTAQGDNHVMIQAFQGETNGMPYEFDVYTGVHIPGIPQNLRAELHEDNVSGILRWTAPKSGMDGGYIRQTGIRYYLCHKVKTIYGTEEWDITNEIGTDVFEFGFGVDDDTSQHTMSLGIAAENEAGIGSVIATTDFTVGIPYTTPAEETFSGSNGSSYSPMLLSSEGESKVNWSIGNPAEIGQQYAVSDAAAVIGTTATETHGCITLPKFSTLNQHKVGFMPTLYLGGCDNIKVTASASGVAETEIMDLSSLPGGYAEGYRQIEINLPEAFQNKGWVEIKIYPYFTPEHSVFVMDGYRMKNLIEKDLAVSMADKTRGFVGETITFRATVTNIGITECEFAGGKFTLTDDKGNVIAEKTVEKGNAIPVDEYIDVCWDFVPSVDNVGTGNLLFKLAGSDMNDTNDSYMSSCEFVKGRAIVVDDLAAKVGTDGVALAWTAPRVRNGLESFEDYVPFVTDDARLGEFTNIWDDSLDAYALKTSGDATKVLKDVLYKTGFHVYNSDKLNELFGRGAVPYAVDGEQLLIAFCPSQQADGTTPSADDWLISPLVKGGTVFSFSGSTLSNIYGLENLEICYSTEDTTDPSEFKVLKLIEVGNADSSQPVEWQDFSVTLPDDARRVAIHYISRDIFCVCIDNVNYTPEGGKVSVTGYEVYRSEGDASGFSKLGEVATCGYSDKTANLGIENRYYVLPVISDGSRGEASNVVVVDLSGVEEVDGSRFIGAGNNEIVIRGYDGKQAVVTTVDGKVIARTMCSATTRIKVLPGIYIVNVADSVAKLRIR